MTDLERDFNRHSFLQKFGSVSIDMPALWQVVAEWSTGESKKHRTSARFLSLRYDELGNWQQTLKKIGLIEGVTGARVHQRVNIAIRRLMNPQVVYKFIKPKS